MDTILPNNIKNPEMRDGELEVGGETAVAADARDGAAAPSIEWTADYAFHRHCQKTVCSAAGYDGAGKTWHVLDSAYFPNIQIYLTGNPADTTWKDGFSGNTDAVKNNITYDLWAILDLLNRVAGKVIEHTSKFTLRFIDSDGSPVDEKEIDPWRDVDEYEFTGFGRTVTLVMGASDVVAARFNTMKPVSTDKLKLTTKNINFRFNGEDSFTSVEAVMPTTKTVSIPYHNIDFYLGSNISMGTVKVATGQDWVINVPKDWNRIPANTGFNSGNSVTEGAVGTVIVKSSYNATTNLYTINLHPDIHIYRIEHSDAKDIMLKINFFNYQGTFTNRNRGQQIVEFEVHVSNQSGATRTITNITDTGTDTSFARHNRWISDYPSDPGITPIIYHTYLNDLTTINHACTNAFVFRVDMFHVSMTWSLAYITKVNVTA